MNLWPETGFFRERKGERECERDLTRDNEELKWETRER